LRFNGDFAEIARVSSEISTPNMFFNYFVFKYFFSNFSSRAKGRPVADITKESNMSKENEFKDLSDIELLQKRKAVKSSLIVTCIIMGFLVGIAIYSAVKNGIGFFTFFPLFFVFIIAKNQANNKALFEEIKLRNLK